jgi:hypothetical protein
VDQTPITCVGEYVRILWLSENLLRTDIRLRGLVFDCRSRKWLNVRGFPVSVDKEEKNVIYVGRDWKVLEKPLAECPEVPWDPKRPDESVKEVMDTIDMYPPGAKSPEKAAGAK